MIWVIIAAFGLLVFVLGWGAVNVPQSRLSRWLAVVGFVALVLGWGAVLIDMQARPKAKSVEWRVGVAEVVASLIKQDEAIYLWVVFEDIDEPRAYWLPWSEEAQQALEDAMGDAEQDGSRVMVSFDGLFADEIGEEENELVATDMSLEDRAPQMFYPAPQRTDSPKQTPTSTPTIQFGEAAGA